MNSLGLIRQTAIASTQIFGVSRGIEITLPSIESIADKYIAQGYGEDLALEMAFAKNEKLLERPE